MTDDLHALVLKAVNNPNSKLLRHNNYYLLSQLQTKGTYQIHHDQPPLPQWPS